MANRSSPRGRKNSGAAGKTEAAKKGGENSGGFQSDDMNTGNS